MKDLINIDLRIEYGKKIRDTFLSDTDLFIYKKHDSINILYSNKDKFEKYIINHLGTIGGSVDAEAYKLKLKKKYKLALKICPLTKYEYNKLLNIQYKIWKELEILKIIFNLLQNYISPNLPIIYFYFICNNMDKNDYKNPNIKKYYNTNKIRNQLSCNIKSNYETSAYILERMKKKKDYGLNSLCIINELCDTTIKDILSSKEIENIDNDIFKSFIFQIISGIYALIKYGNIVHFDLHGGNVLISKINSGGFWAYQINNQKFYLPNYGYLLKIWDFGRSYILKKDSNESIITQLKSQMIRFMNKLFEEDENLKKDMYNTLNSDNLPLVCFCFDLWRIISYILSKLIKSEYLSYKYSETIQFLEKIKKKCIYNWIYGLVNRNISNNLDKFISNLLSMFKEYTKQHNITNNNIINNIIYKS